MNEPKSAVPDISRPRPRQWRGDGKTKTLAGRWSKARIAEELEVARTKRFTLADLAKLVYGTNTLTFRESVRRRLPGQRVYMLGLMKPFVTEYGPRGVVVSIKFYEPDDADDREALTVELDRLMHRNELSYDRYKKLAVILRLPPPSELPELP
jgi:hypothetical protein